MKIWPHGAIDLDPGDACRPPKVHLMLERLSRYELEDLLLDVAIFQAEAFEEALIRKSQRHARRTDA